MHPDLQPPPPPPRRPRRSHRRRRPSLPPPPQITTTNFSDSDSTTTLECGSSGIFSYNHSRSSSDEEIDLESGELELKVHAKNERNCRICHLNFDDMDDDVRDGGGDDVIGGGEVMELGCKCKGDLGAAHKQCADTWFKIKGNLTCEICGATAQNVGGEQTNNAIETEPAEGSAAASMIITIESRTFWQGRRIMNILLGCMVFAFIISWLFHFNVLP